MRSGTLPEYLARHANKRSRGQFLPLSSTVSDALKASPQVGHGAVSHRKIHAPHGCGQPAQRLPPPQPRPLAAAALPGGLAWGGPGGHCWGSQEAAAPQPRPRPLPRQLAAPPYAFCCPRGVLLPPPCLTGSQAPSSPTSGSPARCFRQGSAAVRPPLGSGRARGRAQAATAQRPQVAPRGGGLVWVCGARAPRRSSTAAWAQPAPASRGSPRGVILAVPACNGDKEPRRHENPKAGSRWAAEQRRRLH